MVKEYHHYDDLTIGYYPVYSQFSVIFHHNVVNVKLYIWVIYYQIMLFVSKFDDNYGLHVWYIYI